MAECPATCVPLMMNSWRPRSTHLEIGLEWQSSSTSEKTGRAPALMLQRRSASPRRRRPITWRHSRLRGSSSPLPLAVKPEAANGCATQLSRNASRSSTSHWVSSWGNQRFNRSAPAWRALLNGFNDKIDSMAVAKGSRIRRDHTPTVLFQTRVDPAIRAEVNQAAAASGVSTGIYLEALLRLTLADQGQLPILDLIRDPKEELLIPAA
jgi:hypothetical protein